MATADTVESLLNVGRDMLPKNIIKASAESSYLGIMVAACAALPVCHHIGYDALYTRDFKLPHD